MTFHLAAEIGQVLDKALMAETLRRCSKAAISQHRCESPCRAREMLDLQPKKPLFDIWQLPQTRQEVLVNRTELVDAVAGLRLGLDKKRTRRRQSVCCGRGIGDGRRPNQATRWRSSASAPSNAQRRVPRAWAAILRLARTGSDPRHRKASASHRRRHSRMLSTVAEPRRRLRRRSWCQKEHRLRRPSPKRRRQSKAPAKKATKAAKKR